jgi:hypothetical protein
MTRPLIIREHNRAYIAAQVASAPEGHIVTIREPTRTLDQNALLWPLLQDLSRQVEWAIDGVPAKLKPEEWKDIATAALVKEQRWAMGMDGGVVFLGQHTSTMSKRKFSDLLEVIYAFGSRHGVQWSTPDPREAAA